MRCAIAFSPSPLELVTRSATVARPRRNEHTAVLSERARPDALSRALGTRLPHAATRQHPHFITDELAKRGPTRFFSLRYSRLSKYKQDLRLPLDETANRVVVHRGVECYLWRTLVHPFNTRRVAATGQLMFRAYAARPPAQLVQWIRESDVIVLESGTAVAFIRLCKRLNPEARLVYRALPDGLSTIERWRERITREFDNVCGMLDAIALVSPMMAEEINSQHNVYHVGHGVDPRLEALGDPDPYPPTGIHAVSVGSMLFDPTCIAQASRDFPQVTFHVIGSGHGREPDYGDNVIVYGEMKHAGVVRYMKHARFGIVSRVSLALCLASPCVLPGTAGFRLLRVGTKPVRLFYLKSELPYKISRHCCRRLRRSAKSRDLKA